ncbi:MAG: hypothetical protein JWN49_480 [Parcubacteria group bacterium]|nr:hypothetical protein [Parcubacteria group bacterium]
MSVKKSWDIQAKPRRQAPPAAPSIAPAQRVATPVRRRIESVAPPRPTASQKPAPVKSLRPAPLPKGSLKQRRKKKRQTARYVFLFIVLVIIAGAFYALWQPFDRIQTVQVQGPDSDIAHQIALTTLGGTYWHLVPRNSTFFFPSAKIRAAVLDANPDLSAVSFSRTSFSSLEIRTTARASVFIWCGTTIDTPYSDGSCFDADIEGLLFKIADPSEVGTASSTTNRIRVFSGLDREIDSNQSPVRAHVAYSSAIPEALKFVTAVQQLGVPVSALALRGDEADLWVQGPTRITYVLGHEKDAAELAASSLPNLALTNGSIQYVDLRFPGKVYIKKYGE